MVIICGYFAVEKMSAKGENMYVVEHVHFMKPQTLNPKS
jgi:hypothetical protein